MRLRTITLLPLTAIAALAISACSPTPSEPTAPAAPVAAAPAAAIDATGDTTAEADARRGSDATAAPKLEIAPDTTIGARVTARSVDVHERPDSSSPTVATFGASTPLGSKTTLLVVDSTEGWVEVALPIRPNGSRGWVRLTDVELRSNPMALRVDLAAHTLTLTRLGQTVLQTTVATGTKQNPTPAGSFYVTDLIETDDPNGAYGPFAFGLSAHSETLSEFAGGDGQVGIHGTNDPSSIGRSVSHGCVRVPNEVARTLVGLVPLGTPVTIA